MKPYRIVLADDHVLVREGIRNLIEKRTDFVVVGEADNGLLLLDLLKKVDTDMVILDISMPESNGLEVIRQIKKQLPDVAILVLTMHKDKEYLYQSFERGVDGYLLKEDAGDEMFSAVTHISQGRRYVSPTLAGDVTYELVRNGQQGKPMKQNNALTEREKEILPLIAEGKANKEIAETIRLSIRTVEHYRAGLMRKLNIKDTASLVKYAIREGYTSINF